MLDPYAPQAGLVSCEPSPKPGVLAFRDRFLERWGGTDGGIARECPEDGAPTSKHHEGRAWDWFPPDEDTADAALAELLAAGAEGDHELARRAGIRTIIWRDLIWVSSPPYEWQHYPKGGHYDHVHFGFGWPGARAETSMYAKRPRQAPLWPFRPDRNGAGGDDDPYPDD